MPSNSAFGIVAIAGEMASVNLPIGGDRGLRCASAPPHPKWQQSPCVREPAACHWSITSMLIWFLSSMLSAVTRCTSLASMGCSNIARI